VALDPDLGLRPPQALDRHAYLAAARVGRLEEHLPVQVREVDPVVVRDAEPADPAAAR
jgi:hypothetical protein